jgi:hypothetical protein
MTDLTKTEIVRALRAFIAQRPGLEFANYGDWRSYNAEAASITRDLRDAQTLLGAVALRDSITAADVLAACSSAFSGRLKVEAVTCKSGVIMARIDYCTGQYWPTEYRRAVAAVCASALWYHVAGTCMPEPSAWEVVDYTDCPPRVVKRYATEAEARDAAASGYPLSDHPLYDGLGAGDWLRRHFRREFGRAIASRFFS